MMVRDFQSVVGIEAREQFLDMTGELAERVGISNVNMSKIKNNKATAIRFSALAAICEVLDCEAGDILEYQRDK